QAEDGIRDRNVTGVQTCALPISEAQASDMRATFGAKECDPVVIPNVIRDRRTTRAIKKKRKTVGIVCRLHPEQKRVDHLLRAWRSEERRVGKEWKTR